MVYNNVILRVTQPRDVPKVAELLEQLASKSQREPGCERFEVYHSDSDPQVFLLIEHWASQADLDAHRTAPAFTQLYQPNVLPLVERTPHACRLIAG